MVKHLVVVTLDDLEEEGGSVLEVLGEDLQQVAVIVKVHQDLQLLQLWGCLSDHGGMVVLWCCSSVVL